VDQWRDFVAVYHQGTDNEVIELLSDIAIDASPEAIGETTGNHFTINGRKFKLDSGFKENLGFVFKETNKKSITFEDMEFTKFKNIQTDASLKDGGVMNARGAHLAFLGGVSFTSNSSINGLGGALYAENSTFSFVSATVLFASNTAINGGALYIAKDARFSFTNSQITFINNTANANPNDVYFEDATSELIFSGNNTLANGIITDGNTDAQISISKDAKLNFNGNSNIKNTVANDGNVVFNSGVSTVAVMNVSADAGLYLKNTSLTANTLNLANGSILSFEIDFQNALAPILFSDAITFNDAAANLAAANGVTLEIINLTPYAPKREITIVSAKSYFDWTKFNYNTDSYELFFDKNTNELRIINTPKPAPAPPSPYNFDYIDLSENQSDIFSILSGDEDLLSAFSRLTESKMKESLDSLSGVFLVNIIDAMSYNNSIVPLSRRLIPDDKYWAAINFNSMKFDNADNTLGTFKGSGASLNAGLDLYENDPIKAGAFLSLGISNYTQAENTASVFNTKAGLYGNANHKGIGANAEFGAVMSKASAKREAHIGNTYYSD
jgi:predicted outer membrane repeat protein